MFPFLALVSFAALLQGILNSHEIFGPSGLAPILFNLCFIVVPWLVGNRLGNPARAMAVGVVIGGLAQAPVQVPAVIRLGTRFGFMNPARAFRNPGMRKVFALIAPTILGMAAYQVNDLVSTAFASRAGMGVASSLQYSLRLQELILASLRCRRAQCCCRASPMPSGKAPGANIRARWGARCAPCFCSPCRSRSFPWPFRSAL